MFLLPGLVFLALAAALVVLLRRLYDPLPWAEAALFLGLVVLLLGPVLFAGRTVLPVGVLLQQKPFSTLLDARPDEEAMDLGNTLQGDLIHQIYPAWLQVRRAVAAGEWPLLNPHAGAGMPLLADPQSQALQPLAWLPGPLDPVDGFAVTLALRLLLAMVFTALFLRRLGMARPAAVAGAVSYGLGGFVLLWLGWPLATSGTALPIILYGVERVCASRRGPEGSTSPGPGADRTETGPAESERRDPEPADAELVVTGSGLDGRRRDVLLLAAALFTLLTSGHPETVLHVLLLAAAFGSSRWLAVGREAPEGERWRRRLRVLRDGATAGVLALALAAPMLLAAAHFLPHTLRAELVEATAQRVRSGPWIPDGWARPVMPAGDPLPEVRVAAQVAPRAYGDHRFGGYWGPRNINVDAGGFAGTLALAALLAALGGGLRRRPGERVMLAALALSFAVVLRLPPLEKLFFSLPLLDRSISFHSRVRVLVTFCLAYLLAATLDRWLAGELRPRRLLVAGAVTAGWVAWGYLAHPPPAGFGELAWIPRRGLAVQLAVLGAATLAVAVATASAHLPRARDGRPLAASALALLAAAELLLLHGASWPAMPRPLAYPPMPVTQWLTEQQSEPTDHRVVSLAGLRPEIPLVYGVSTPGIANPLKPAQYARLLSPLVRSIGAGGESFVARDHPLYDLLGVRYVVVPYGHRPPPHYRLRLRAGGGRIMERPAPLPVAWLPEAARACAAGVGTKAGARTKAGAGAKAGTGTAARRGTGTAPGGGGRAEPTADDAARATGARTAIPALPEAPAWGDCLAEVRDFRREARVARLPEGLGLYAVRAGGRKEPGGAKSEGGEPGGAWRARRESFDWSGLADLGPSRLAGEAFLLEPRLLATRLYQDGGWRVLADGEPLPTLRANGPFVAAVLPPGGYVVDLVHRPPGFPAGLLLAALGLAVGIAFLVPPPRWAVDGRPSRRRANARLLRACRT